VSGGPPAIKALTGLADLDEALATSSTRPLVIFKHSEACGTSYAALDELLEHVTSRPGDAEYVVVTVQQAREVSTAVARRLGVRHETPQVIVVRNGCVLWSASHFRVTAEALQKTLEQTPDPAREPERTNVGS